MKFLFPQMLAPDTQTLREWEKFLENFFEEQTNENTNGCTELIIIAIIVMVNYENLKLD